MIPRWVSRDGCLPVIALLIVGCETFGGEDEHSLRWSEGEKEEKGNEEQNTHVYKEEIVVNECRHYFLDDNQDVKNYQKGSCLDQEQSY